MSEQEITRNLEEDRLRLTALNRGTTLEERIALHAIKRALTAETSLELAVKALEEIETHIADFTVRGNAEHFHTAYIEVKKLAQSTLSEIRRTNP